MLSPAHHGQFRLSGRAGLTLYTVIRELQRLLPTWTGACITCHQPVKPLHRQQTPPNLTKHS